MPNSYITKTFVPHEKFVIQLDECHCRCNEWLALLQMNKPFQLRASNKRPACGMLIGILQKKTQLDVNATFRKFFDVLRGMSGNVLQRT